MARYPAFLYTSAADPIARVQLPWEADNYTVINPTRFTIAVRIGSGSRPDAGNADMAVPPLGAISLPTKVREFMFVATTPALPLAPDGMPTVVSLLFTKGEPAPAFSSMALSGMPSPQETVLLNHPTGGGSPFVVNVPISSAIRGVSFYPGNANNISSYLIVGAQSGVTYAQVDMSLLSSLNRAHHDVYPALDTSLNVTVISGGTNPFVLVGRATPPRAGIESVEGVPRVILWQDPGNFASRVIILNNAGNPFTSWPAVPPPAHVAVGAVVAPALNAVIATATVAVAGDYRVEAELSSTDVAAVGKYIVLRWNAGVKGAAFQPVGTTGLRVEWGRVTVAAADVFDIINGLAGGAGALYAGMLRLYKLN